MDLMQRGSRFNRNEPAQPTQPANTPTQTQQSASVPPVMSAARSKRKVITHPWFRIASSVMLVSMGILIAALAASFAFAQRGGENNLVKDELMQVVVMNNEGQPPYFGHILKVTSDYIVLGDVWYLISSQAVQPEAENAANNLEVRKLGCEIHGPTDQMVINRKHVLYWENLKSDGRIPKEIASYKESNPNYAQCDDKPANGQ